MTVLPPAPTVHASFTGIVERFHLYNSGYIYSLLYRSYAINMARNNEMKFHELCNLCTYGLTILLFFSRYLKPHRKIGSLKKKDEYVAASRMREEKH